MKIVTDLQKLPVATGYRGVALGNFDGVHLGHQKLIRTMVSDAQKSGGQSVVFSFHPHPMEVLKGKSPAWLTAQTEKETLAAHLGVDYFCRYPFDETIAAMPPRAFVERILRDALVANHVYVGYNYSFGFRGEGDVAALKRYCREYEIDVTVIEPVLSEYGPISSSLIREKLLHGQTRAANTMLGYCYFMQGIVEHGRQVGRQLGFATANLAVRRQSQLPAYGVYAAYFQWRGGFWPTVANVGMRPTFGQFENPVVEAHLLDFDGDLYDEKAILHFVERLRGECPFPNKDALIAQMIKDKEHARTILTDGNLRTYYPNL